MKLLGSFSHQSSRSLMQIIAQAGHQWHSTQLAAVVSIGLAHIDPRWAVLGATLDHAIPANVWWHWLWLGHGWLLGHGFVGLLGHGWLLGHRLCLAASSRYTYAHTSKSSLAAAALPRGRGVLFCRHPGFQCPYGTGILRELMLTWKTAITCMCM